MAIDLDKLQEFMGKFVTDFGATMAAGNVVIGHNLGLYRALAAAPATADELAAQTGTNPRYIAEWLRGQAAGGYVQYDPADDCYSMTEEQAFALTSPDNGFYAPGAFVLALGTLKAVPRIGAQAGEAAIRQVVTDAGFTRFRRATETPLNLIYEVRP
jgi:Rv2258c-like winged HTH domain